MTKTLAGLNAKAQKYYEDNATLDQWLANFTIIELMHLWNDYCIITDKRPFGADYDDEVYDALYELGYFNYV